MKVIGLNGSPRKDWNSAQMLEHALKGAAACAADPDAVGKLEEIAAACETVDLVSAPCFAAAFIGNMRFG